MKLKNCKIRVNFLFFTKNFYDKIFLIGDYKTRPPELYFGIFETFESFVLMPKKPTYFIISLKNSSMFNCK